MAIQMSLTNKRWLPKMRWKEMQGRRMWYCIRTKKQTSWLLPVVLITRWGD